MPASSGAEIQRPLSLQQPVQFDGPHVGGASSLPVSCPVSRLEDVSRAASRAPSAWPPCPSATVLSLAPSLPPSRLTTASPPSCPRPPVRSSRDAQPNPQNQAAQAATPRPRRSVLSFITSSSRYLMPTASTTKLPASFSGWGHARANQRSRCSVEGNSTPLAPRLAWQGGGNVNRGACDIFHAPPSLPGEEGGRGVGVPCDRKGAGG